MYATEGNFEVEELFVRCLQGADWAGMSDNERCSDGRQIGEGCADSSSEICYGFTIRGTGPGKVFAPIAVGLRVFSVEIVPASVFPIAKIDFAPDLGGLVGLSDGVRELGTASEVAGNDEVGIEGFCGSGVGLQVGKADLAE